MRLNQHVRCPADRGDLPYDGRIEHIGTDVQERNGVKFVWVTVRRTSGVYGRSAHVWPSHRLGFRLSDHPSATSH
jgi:hypothetical protein